jgi:uncharacterized phiE125 gp8 family phage protein
MKNSVVTSQPSTEPITLQEAKDNLKITGTLEDSRITSLITSARIWCEKYTNRSLIKQTRIQYQDNFYPCGRLQYTTRSLASVELLNGPLLDVSGTTVISIKYYDSNDTLQTISSSDYWIDITSTIPRVVTKTSWPSTGLRPNAVLIEYYAGYGVDGSYVPGFLKDAMHLYIAHCFENRVPEITGQQIYAFELGINRLLDMGIVYQNAF